MSSYMHVWLWLIIVITKTYGIWSIQLKAQPSTSKPQTVIHNPRNEWAFINHSTLQSQQMKTSIQSKSSIHHLDGRTIPNPLQPIENMILACREEPKSQTSGGLHLLSESRPKQIIAQVLNVGSGSMDPTSGYRRPIELKIGDWIVLNKADGHELLYDGKDCLLIDANNVFATLTKKDSSTLEPDAIQPERDVVFVKIQNTSNQLESGLILSDSNSEKNFIDGFVVAVGPGGYDSYGKRLPMQVKAGDSVRYLSYAQELTFKSGKEKYGFVHMNDILAKW